MDNKKLRLILGLFMFQSFFSMVFFIGFIMSLPFDNRYFYGIAVLVFWYMWIPATLLICQNYYLLTRVFKYKDGE